MTIISNDVEKAQNVLQAFTEDFKTLRSVCLEQGFKAEQCDVAKAALGKGKEGLITPDEEQAFRDAGFSQAFVRELAGVDGATALKTRASWLAEHVVDRWWRWDSNDKEQVAMLEEIAQMGTYANGVLTLVFEALQDSNQAIQEAAFKTLYQLGPIDGSQVQTLVEWIDDEDRRKGGALGLIAVGRSDPAYIPVIMDELKEQKRIENRYRDHAFAPGNDPEGVTMLAALDVADEAKELADTYEKILRTIAVTEDEPGLIWNLFFGPDEKPDD